MFTSKQGSCGVGFLSNVTPYVGGLGLGLSRGAGTVEEEGVDETAAFKDAEEVGSSGDDEAGGCETDWMSSSEK